LIAGNLELSRNQLVGKIPNSIYNLVLLTQLSLDDNMLTGSISTLLGQLTSLNILEMNVNQLTGSLPETLYTLPALENICVSDNRLSGTLSEQLIMLNLTLKELSAANNSLTGEWPNALFESLPELGTFLGLQWREIMRVCWNLT
jgi:Leucine-rich repeat (LRR) protein